LGVSAASFVANLTWREQIKRKKGKKNEKKNGTAAESCRLAVKGFSGVGNLQLEIRIDVQRALDDLVGSLSGGRGLALVSTLDLTPARNWGHPVLDASAITASGQ
jgi:hypothetical protein